MLANHGDNRTREDPLTGRLVRVVVIDCPTGRVVAVNGISCSAISGICYGCINAAVI